MLNLFQHLFLDPDIRQDDIEDELRNSIAPRLKNHSADQCSAHNGTKKTRGDITHGSFCNAKLPKIIW